ncbi:hypothetical protein PHYSODRAFT_527646, partial [Phytophthora sojae]
GSDRTPVCASNAVLQLDARTYSTNQNTCYFNLANCDNKGLKVLHYGMCRRKEGGRRLRDAQA